MHHKLASRLRYLPWTAGTLLALAMLPVQAQPDTHGAIAWSRRTNAQGYAWGYRSRLAAENRALQECESRSGIGDCQIVLWFRNACGSIAETADGSMGYAWDGTRLGAERRALDACRRYGVCRVARTFCSYDR
ncbi:MAG: DUF4189 domain-containing protein [Gloeomargarita sp. SKYG116]|nr:DUF4189 domain-containing protein [Gloeomargarita sp. SKYG116]MDW8402286.1 DUF4189 domain-containing protein [Gloeomargarita sp. SKYGB_i_bin116]